MAGKFQIPEPEMRTVSLLFVEDMVGFQKIFMIGQIRHALPDRTPIVPVGFCLHENLLAHKQIM
jgi:hypothetical protein